MIPAAFDYERRGERSSMRSSCSARDGDAKLLAGGHSLIPAMKLRIARPSKLVDIGRLVRARATSAMPATQIAIGALTRHDAVASDPLLAGALPDRRDDGGARSATRRCVTAARSAARSPTATRPPTCPRVMLALDAEFVARRRRAASASSRPPTSSPASSRPRSASGSCSPRSACRSSVTRPAGRTSSTQRRAQDWATVGVAALVRHDERLGRQRRGRPRQHGRRRRCGRARSRRRSRAVPRSPTRPRTPPREPSRRATRRGERDTGAPRPRHRPAARSRRHSRADLLERPHPVVPRVVLDLGEAELLEQRRQVHPEPSAEPFLEPVPAAHRVVGRPPHASTVPSFAGFCSSALPSSTQSPCATSIACRSSIARAS